MSEPQVGDIVVVLGDPKSETRRLIRGAMTAPGYRDIRDCGDVDTTRHVITDTAISSARSRSSGRYGDNPFVPVIMLTWDANADIIRKAAACGVDDILAAPISPADSFGRIKDWSRAEKPFVVTSDYIGPTARGSRTGRSRTALIDETRRARKRTANR